MRLGWLNPDGKFYECESTEHSWAAKRLCEEYGYSVHDWDYDNTLLEKGWVRITQSLYDYAYSAYWEKLNFTTKNWLKNNFYNQNLFFNEYNLRDWKYEIEED